MINILCLYPRSSNRFSIVKMIAVLPNPTSKNNAENGFDQTKDIASRCSSRKSALLRVQYRKVSSRYFRSRLFAGSTPSKIELELVIPQLQYLVGLLDAADDVYLDSCRP